MTDYLNCYQVLFGHVKEKNAWETFNILKNANTLPTWRETYTSDQWKEHILLLAEKAFSKQINFTTMTQEEYDAIQAHNK